MPCEPCKTEREYPGHRMFSLGCIHCGARIIQRIQGIKQERTAKTERLKSNLADWVSWGHDEMELRRLAKLSQIPLEPEIKQEPKKKGKK